MAGSPTPPVAPSEGRATSPTTGQVLGGASPIPQGPDEGTLAGPATVTPDGGTPPSPDLGSVGIDGTTQFGYGLKSGAGVALAKSGNAIQVSVDPSGLPPGSIPITDLTPGAADTVANTNGTGTAAQFSKIVNANIASNAAIDITKLALGAADTVLNTNSAGNANQFSKIVNANIASNAAISPSKIATVAAVTPSALDIDWSLGSVFSKTLAAGANAFTFSNAVDGKTIVVRLTSDAGGSTVSWPAGTKWSAGTAPTQTSTGVDVYTFVDIGGTIYGSVVQDMH